MERVTRRLTIEGVVQGVGFRFFMQHKARALGITGWVRNRLNGNVEAVVQGELEAVEEIVALARRGPRSAHVTDVRISDADGQFEEFELRPTE